MQNDYMDFFLESTRQLIGLPQVNVEVDTDTTAVTMSAIGDSARYFQGRYTLPYESNLGSQKDALVVASAMMKDGKGVEDSLSFSYGRFSAEGGKIALGPMSFDIPAGALKTPALLTIVPGMQENAVDTAKKPGEITFFGLPYTIGPATLVLEKPGLVSLTICCRTDGAGIYQLAENGWTYLPGTVEDGLVSSETGMTGAFRLGFDRTPPVVTLKSASPGRVLFTVEDHGSGVDAQTLRASWNGNALVPVYEPETGAYAVNIPGIMTEQDISLAVTVRDRTGNTGDYALYATIEASPGQFTLGQNVPNPFNPLTAIPFAISSDMRITIEIHDILGRRVRVLADEVFPAGTHRVVWNALDETGSPVSSGIYFYRVIAGDKVITRKMVLMR
jgi:hypothetical protein